MGRADHGVRMRPRILASLVLPMLFAAACSSSSGATALKHSCSPNPSLEICTCDAFETGGSDAPSQSGTCNTAVYANAVCCAQPGWPGHSASGGGTSCSCVGAGSSLYGSGGCPNQDQELETVQVDSCDFTGTATTSGSDSGAPKKCTDTGYCSPDGDNCTCGTQCIHYGPGEYMCGFDCASTSDCTGKKDPPSGDALPTCHPGLQTDTADYDGYCVRQ